MNMIIHDDGHTNVIGFDALDDVEKMDKQNHGFAKNRFDVIVTNPPFGAKKNSFVKIIILNTINWLKKKKERLCQAKRPKFCLLSVALNFKIEIGQMAIRFARRNFV